MTDRPSSLPLAPLALLLAAAVACDHPSRGPGPPPPDGADLDLASPIDGGVPLVCESRFFIHDSPGADRVWATADDVIAKRYVIHHEGGRVTSQVVYSGPGADAVWATADDVVQLWTTLHYDTAGHLDHADGFLPGADGLMGTVDDRMINRTTSRRDLVAHRTVELSYGGPGPDQAWGTSDDVIGSRVVVGDYPGDAPSPFEGFSSMTYDGPGPDGVWGTEDDRLRQRRRLTYDVAGIITVTWATAPGADGVWDTPDDALELVDRYQCNLGVAVTFADPGPDRAWNTADDGIVGRSVLDGAQACVSLCQSIIF